jgi:hypothetical protein
VRYQPRCKVCRHSERTEIDVALATHRPYVRIGERFGVPYRSLANHLQRHLDFDDPIVSRAVEDQLAVARRNHEIGVEAAIERRLMLDFCIRVYYERLVRSA